jgi:excisionase family DNA binding protein
MEKTDLILNELSNIRKEVQALSATINSFKNREKNILSLKALCELLECSAAAIYGKVSRNEIPFHKEPGGRKLYFDVQEIEAWLKGSKNV